MNPHQKVSEANGSRVHLLSVVSAIFIWSFSFIATKIALTSFPPFRLGMIRFGLAAIFFSLPTLLRKRIDQPTANDAIKIVISGLLGITLYFALENLGVKYSTTADAALIVASYPALTILLEVLLFGKKYPLKSFTGVGLAIAGVYLIVSQDPAAEETARLLGNLLLVLAGIVWAGYNFLTHSIASKYSTSTITLYQLAAGTAGFIPLSLLETTAWVFPPMNSLLAVLYLGGFCSLLAFCLYVYGLQKISSGTAVILMNLVPVFGVLFSFVVLKESITVTQIGGGVVIIAGILLSVGSSDEVTSHITDKSHS
jgi:drug/metabolite transporter (DMT)-like permease